MSEYKSNPDKFIQKSKDEVKVLYKATEEEREQLKKDFEEAEKEREEREKQEQS